MRVLFISGNHKRHMSVIRQVYEAGHLAAMVLERRENMIPVVPEYLSPTDREYFIHHFELRDKCEEKYFGNDGISEISNDIPRIEIDADELNSDKVVRFLLKHNPDLVLTYGPGLIENHVLDIFPNKFFNIHGGFSPWYKGAATMFWPFYFLRPNWAGMTIHRIINKIDAGDILHHSFPSLEHGDRMHDVACKATIQVAEDLTRILDLLDAGAEISCRKQTKTGKLFLESDWQPEMLRVIYGSYRDKLVDAYLDGDIISPAPREIVSFFEK